MIAKLLPVIIGAAAMVVAVPAGAEQRRSPEEQLQRELRGRVAGEPVNCVNLRDVRSTRVIEGTAIVYDAGSVVYVNRPRTGAESLNRWDVQVVRPFGSRLCSIDTVTMVDRPSGFLSGIVFLGDFVPYRRVRD